MELDGYDLEEFQQVAAGFGEQRFGYVVTPNVDHFLRLRQDENFRLYYRRAAYVLLDSRVVARFIALTTGRRFPVCTGADLTAALLAQTVQPADRIVLIGGDAQQAGDLRAKYGLQDLRQHVPPMGFVRQPEAVEACLQFIEAQSPFRFCFLAVGSPQQELLADALAMRGKARGLALCVGASLNFLTGHEARAPRWMQRLSLEWLFRLAQDPRRMFARYVVRGPRFFLRFRQFEFTQRPRRTS